MSALSDRSDAGESSTARLYRAALGEASAGYYLPLFARFDTQGVAGPVWNGAAALLHLGWLLHHRLWRPLARVSALATVLAVVVAGLWQFAPGWPIGVKLGASISMLLVVGMVPGLWGSAWLHARVRHQVIKAIKLAPTVDAACEALSAEARDRQRRNTWGLAGLLSAGALAALLWKTVPWLSLLGGASVPKAPSMASKEVGVPVDPFVRPSPAVAVLTPSGAETAKVEAVQPSTPAIAEPGKPETGTDGGLAPVPVQAAAPTAGQAAVQDKSESEKQTAPERSKVGESAAARSQLPKPVEKAAGQTKPSLVKKAVTPLSTPPDPDAKSSLKPGPESLRSDSAEVGAPVAGEARLGAPKVVPDGPNDIRPRARSFGVAVGMFAVTENAERVVARLAGAGLPVISDSVASARGELTRVRVGPFERREQAAAAADKVKALGLEAKIYAP